MATPPTPVRDKPHTAVLEIPGTDQVVVVGVVPAGAATQVLNVFHHSHTPQSWHAVTRAEAIAKYPEGRAWDAPEWTADDDDRFAWVAAKGSNRTLLGFLRIAEQGSLTGAQIASQTEYDDAYSWRAALPHIRAYCSRVDRKPIWSVRDHDDAGRSVFTTRPAVRELALRHLAHLG